ncbi:MAG: hypothetical protein JWM11_5708 [Planctomycetaceae bacterium]|nr:hypothetical protein [Planctomycetaceae bacterium]
MEIHEIARWTAWPSLLCYALAVGMRIGPRPGDWKAWSERIWLTGWLMLVFHIFVAMGAVHHWSLAEATRHTATQTQAAVGLNWGGGVWFNFATVAVWAWTLLPSRKRTLNPSRLNSLAQWYLAFMMFNATVVFGTRVAQTAGAVICAGLLARYLTPERPR